MFSSIKEMFENKKEVKNLEKENKRLENYIRNIESQLRHERLHKEHREKEIALDKKLSSRELEADRAWQDEESQLELSQERRRLEESLRASLADNDDELFEARKLAKESEALIKIYEKKESSLEKQVVEYRSIISELIALIPKVDLSKFNINVDVDVPQKDINVNCK